MVKPREWQVPLNENNLPRFYYLHKPKGSPDLKYGGVEPTGPLPESVDFPLYPQEEPDTFKAILFGDPQPRTQQEVDYMSHDVIAELVGTDASFGVTLGDITFDDLSLFEPQAQSIALLGIPWYNVIGNHDINYDARNDRDSDDTFERAFGPAYYSFDYGTVHFLVLDDILWEVKSDTGKGSYRGGLGEEQMEFIRNDLAMIPEDQLVVLMMHIPLMDVGDRQELYRLIEQRPYCVSISAHRHVHQHFFLTKKDGWEGPEPHHHIVNVTVSGSWWQGAPDERGIPNTLMADGAPNGYSIMTFDGHNYSLDFRAAGRSADYQMLIQAPDEVPSSETGKADLYVNVFNGSERSTVEFSATDNGEWLPMQKVSEPDPNYIRAVEFDQSLGKHPWKELPKPGNSTHLWKTKLPSAMSPGSYLLRVRTTDMDGKSFESYRVLRVTKG
ncbi:MAG TPA: calcineurin-like phosphoesterase C-terminal domain-containing protein [Planctomycetaceae bacterium]|nr:calcineurin-like phosphoesterase C-terminal domain-containing protein [Planctomycetaceae bacterium]